MGKFGKLMLIVRRFCIIIKRSRSNPNNAIDILDSLDSLI